MPRASTDGFADLPDPRLDCNKRHLLTDVLTIALCAAFRGANTWEQLTAYGIAKHDWFVRYLPLPYGIPSHDAFYRVLSALNPRAFAERLGPWMAAACEATGLIPTVTDGKSTRRTKRSTAANCLHRVSAWPTEGRLTLGQVAAPGEPNETAVIPELLRTLELTGALVTIDAAGCQAENARLIRAGGGDYVLAVKGDNPALEGAVRAVLDHAGAAGFEGVRHDVHPAVEVRDGCHKERCVTVIYDPVGLPSNWPDVAAVVRVARGRKSGGKGVSAAHYYLSSYAGTAAELGGLVHGNWCIENGLHWALEVAFREDESRKRSGHAGENLDLLRRAAMCLLKRAGKQGGVETRRFPPRRYGPRRPYPFP
jgi:predicted transposase YbfD/YdcC